jgi:hypothetical protein
VIGHRQIDANDAQRKFLLARRLTNARGISLLALRKYLTSSPGKRQHDCEAPKGATKEGRQSQAQTGMNADWAYRGFGASLVSTAVGWVAERAGMSHWEAFIAFVLVLVGLQMLAGNKSLE